jgi:transposase
MTYSVDFRKKVLQIKAEEGLSCEEVSKRFKIGIMSVVRWGKRVEPKRTRNKPTLKIDMTVLRKDIEEYPDAYHYERAGRLGVSPSGIMHALRRLGVSYKKNAKSSQGRSRKTCFILPEAQRAKGVWSAHYLHR